MTMDDHQSELYFNHSSQKLPKKLEQIGVAFDGTQLELKILTMSCWSIKHQSQNMIIQIPQERLTDDLCGCLLGGSFHLISGL